MSLDCFELRDIEKVLSRLQLPGIVINADKRIISANSYFEEMVGKQKDTLILSSLDSMIMSDFLLEKNLHFEDDLGHVLLSNDKIMMLINETEVEVEVSVIFLTNFRKAILFNIDLYKLFPIEKDYLDLYISEVLLEISTEISHCNSDKIEEAINISIEKLGKYTRSDRAFIFMIDGNGTSASSTHEWCANNIESEKDNLQNIPIDTIPWWIKQLNDHEVIHTYDVNKMPAEAQKEKEILQAQDIKSVLVLPILNENKLIGFVGFDSVRGKKKWSHISIEALRIVANMYGALFAKFKYFETCISLELHYSAAFNDAIAPTIIFDKDRIITKANRQWKEVFGYNPDDLIGRDWTELVNKNYIEMMKQYHNQRRTCGHEFPREYETIIHDTYGGNRECNIIVSIIPGTSNFIASVFDLTRLRRLEKFVSMLTELNASNMDSIDEISLLVSVCNEFERVGGYAAVCFCEIEKSGKFSVKSIANSKTYDALHCERILSSINTSELEKALVKDQVYIQRDLLTNLGESSLLDYSETDNLGSFIVIPIINHNSSPTITLTLFSDESNSFDKMEARLLEDMKRPLSFVIELYRKGIDSIHTIEMSGQKLRELAKQSIIALRAVVSIRDPYTATHQEKVAILAEKIAVDLGLSALQVEEIFIAASIHDIGKINVPSDILNKPGKLNMHEFELVKGHCKIGSEIISNMNLPWNIGRIILEHHERIDGSGYPTGLKRNEICLGAKIICVADVYDAMSTHRPYRPALGEEVAIEELQEGSGIIYDQEVVESLVRVVTKRV